MAVNGTSFPVTRTRLPPRHGMKMSRGRGVFSHARAGPAVSARGALRISGILFTSIGVVILLFAFYEVVGTTAITKRHQATLQREFGEILAAQAEPPAGTPNRPVAPLPTPTPEAPIARLRIPKIGLDVIVVEGVSRSALAKGPGHYPRTADPGARGPSAIAGHRTGWGAPFFDLNRLQTGDRVVVETSRATFTYLVTRKTIVEPSAVWVLNGDPRSGSDFRLTLTTCTPKFTARDRLVVWADLVRAVPRGGAI